MRRFLAAGALVLILAAPGTGQEPAEPGLFETQLLKYRAFFGYGGFEPDLERIFPEGYWTKWTPSVSLDATYTDNVDKDERSENAGWLDGALGLGWLRRSPRLQASADYRYSTPIVSSGAVSDRNLSTHAAAGAVRWQAARHLSVSAGAHATQNFDQGMGAPLPGVRSSYSNRSDEYGVTGEYSWRASKNVTNRGGYDFSYRNYLSKKAEGEDSLRHHGSEALGWQMTPRDRLDLGYDYVSERTLGDSLGRQTHRVDSSWGHRLLWFPDYRSAEVGISNAFERTLEEEGTSYWSDSVQARYSQGLSTRTTVGAHGGYKWIIPDEGDRQGSWVGGADVSHRFSEHTRGSAAAFHSLEYVSQDEEARRSWGYRGSLDHRFGRYTSGTLSASQSWQYEPATSRTDVTVLTRTRQVGGTVSHRFSKNLRGSARASYLEGDPQDAGDGPYWQGSGGATVTVTVGRDGFVGAGYSLTRRQTDESDDDFQTHTASLFYRKKLLDWLHASARYSYEREDFDAPSSQEGYRENRVSFRGTAVW